MCAAPTGNKYWKLRSKHGRNTIFDSPESLWEHSCGYFKWCDDNPIQEEKLFHYQGKVVRDKINKLRPYTIGGLYLFLGVNKQYFDDLKEDFSVVITRIQETCREQKFAGAVSEQMNPNIIARDLGLADKSKIDQHVSVERLNEDVTIGYVDENGFVVKENS